MKYLISILAIILVALLVVTIIMTSETQDKGTDTESNILEDANALITGIILLQTLGNTIPILMSVIAGIIISYFILKKSIRKLCDYQAKRISEEIWKEYDKRNAIDTDI